MSANPQSLSKDVGVPVKKMSRFSFGAWMWVLVAGMVPIQRFLLAEVSNYLQYVVLALIVACALLGRVARPYAAPLWAIVIVLAPIAALISGTNSGLLSSLIVGIKVALLIGLTPFVLSFFVRTYDNFVFRCCAAFIIVQSASAVIGIGQLLGVNLFGTQANSGRANGIAGHPNVLGLMATIAILICVYALIRKRARAPLIVALLLINGGALIATGSLSSMIACAVGLTVLLVALRVTIKAFIFVVLGVSVLAAVLVSTGYDPTVLTASVQDRIDEVTGESSGVASLGIRESTYRFAWQYLSHDPIIGVGMDSANQATFDGHTVVHNYLLRAWYQGGITFGLLIAAITVVFVILTWRALAKGTNAVGAAVAAAILAFAFTSAFFDQQQYWLPLLLVVAALPIPQSRTLRPTPTQVNGGLRAE